MSRTLKGLALTGVIIVLLWLEHLFGRGVLTERAPFFLRDGCPALLLENGFFLVIALIAVAGLVLKEYRGMAAGLGIETGERFMFLTGSLLLLYLWGSTVCRYGGAVTCPLFLHDAEFGAIIILCIAVMLRLSWRSVRGCVGGSTAATAASVFGIIYIVLPFSFLVATRLRWGAGALFMVLAVCKLTDVGAYYFGKLIGGARMAPAVSPNKTWTGLLGGVLTAVGGALVIRPWAPVLPGPAAAVLFGLSVALVAVLGDLAESLIKREAGLKDSGRVLEGYGGLLDMVDDLLFVAPWAYLFLAGASVVASWG